MATPTNPYPQIGTELTEGLNAIAKAAPKTIDDLANAIYNYVQPIYYPTNGPVPKALEIEIKSVVYNMANAYNNKLLGIKPMYNDTQMSIIDTMLGFFTTSLTPVNALDLWLADVEDNITRGRLNSEEETPLFLATEVGENILNYWKAAVDKPKNWSVYFEADAYKNYANISLWTAAAMQGALLGANASEKGLIAPTTDITSVNIISALIGALTVGAGKVIFKWTPRIQAGIGTFPKLALNKDVVANLSQNALLLESVANSDRPKSRLTLCRSCFNTGSPICGTCVSCVCYATE